MLNYERAQRAAENAKEALQDKHAYLAKLFLSDCDLLELCERLGISIEQVEKALKEQIEQL